MGGMIKVRRVAERWPWQSPASLPLPHSSNQPSSTAFPVFKGLAGKESAGTGSRRRFQQAGAGLAQHIPVKVQFYFGSTQEVE
jgi:hypothetical protein